MIGFVIDLIACGGAATAILNSHISRVHAERSRQSCRDTKSFARRCAECAARDPGSLEVDRGTVVPTPRLAVVRALHADSDEARERLVDGAVQRHPHPSPGTDQGMPAPGAGDHRAPAPSARPKS